MGDAYSTFGLIRDLKARSFTFCAASRKCRLMKPKVLSADESMLKIRVGVTQDTQDTCRGKSLI